VVTVPARWAAVAAGVALDRILGEPPALVHPVAGFGTVMELVEDRIYADTRARGALYLGGGLALAALAAVAGSSSTLGRKATWPSLVAATYLTVAGKSLGRAASSVSRPLQDGDLDAARSELRSLVGRDPRCLDEKEITRAVVESVAENTVDAIVAPALWAAAGGARATFAYRAVNTLDAMVGHRSDRYARFGWAAARADDFASWLPARITAALVAAVRPASAGAVWRAVRDQAPAHPSPNAGVAEAAFAAALGVSLGGANTYGSRVEQRPTLGFGPPPAPGDIQRATRLGRDVTAALATALLAPAALRFATASRARGGRR
jgi:adenosylcobinamide-phosphate synthase